MFQLAMLDYNIATRNKHVMSCWRNELLTQKGVIRSEVFKGTSVHHNNIAEVEEKKLKYCRDLCWCWMIIMVIIV